MATASAHAGYSFQAALYLSKNKTIVRDWQHYHLEIKEKGEHITLTAAMAGQAPHKEETLIDTDSVKRFLFEHDFPLKGWLPQELEDNNQDLSVSLRPEPALQPESLHSQIIR